MSEPRISLKVAEFPGILERLKTAMGVSTQAAVASRLGIPPQQISDPKRAAKGQPRKGGSNRIPFQKILEWALSQDVNIAWLLTGQSTFTHGEQDAEGVVHLRRKDDPESAENRELLDLARKTLESADDLARNALAESIKALSRPVKDEKPIKKRARRRSA